MNTLPAMPIWATDYLADTRGLTLEQQGAYMLMLTITWRNDGKAVPDDANLIARYLAIPVSRWLTKIRPALEPLFDLSGGSWFSAKLAESWRHVTEKRAILARNGAKGGTVKTLKNNETVVANATPDAKHLNLNPNHNLEDKKDSVLTDACSSGGDEREGEPQKTVRKPRTVGPLFAEFEEWWSQYPRKVAKGHAAKAYMSARKKADKAEILRGLTAQAQAWATWPEEEKKYIPHPTTWLNGERWYDAPQYRNTGKISERSDRVSKRRRIYGGTEGYSVEAALRNSVSARGLDGHGPIVEGTCSKIAECAEDFGIIIEAGD